MKSCLVIYFKNKLLFEFNAPAILIDVNLSFALCQDKAVVDSCHSIYTCQKMRIALIARHQLQTAISENERSFSPSATIQPNWAAFARKCLDGIRWFLFEPKKTLLKSERLIHALQQCNKLIELDSTPKVLVAQKLLELGFILLDKVDGIRVARSCRLLNVREQMKS